MLTVSEKNALADWDAHCKAPVEHADAFYLDLEALGVGGDVQREVVKAVDLAGWTWSRGWAGERVSVQLLTGFRGSGKTTALKRITRTLEERGFTVLYTDAARVHDLARPISAREFFTMLFALIANHEHARPLWPAFKERALAALPLRLGEAQIGAGVGRSNPSSSWSAWAVGHPSRSPGSTAPPRSRDSTVGATASSRATCSWWSRSTRIGTSPRGRPRRT